MADFIDSIGGETTIQIAAVVLTIIMILVAIWWGKRSLGQQGQNWAEVAQMNGLQFAPKALNINYGIAIGTHTFENPGMAGNYRGRMVQINSNFGTERSDAGKAVLEAAITLNNPKPFTALAYKRNFENLARERIKKDSKTGVKAIDSAFKIRSEDSAFLTPIFERLSFADWLKQQKFRSAHLMFDGKTLYFLGVVNGSKVSAEQALATLNGLCELAEAAA